MNLPPGPISAAAPKALLPTCFWTHTHKPSNLSGLQGPTGRQETALAPAPVSICSTCSGPSPPKGKHLVLTVVSGLQPLLQTRPCPSGQVHTLHQAAIRRSPTPASPPELHGTLLITACSVPAQGPPSAPGTGAGVSAAPSQPRPLGISKVSGDPNLSSYLHGKYLPAE